MRPAGLAVLERELLRSAVDRAVSLEDVQRALEPTGTSGYAFGQELNRDRSLLHAAGEQAEVVYPLVVRRQALAESVREVHDPERAYYLGGRPRPAPPDFIGDHLRPAGRALVLGPTLGLWRLASEWGTAPRALYRSVLVLMVLPLTLAALGAAVAANPALVLAVLAAAFGALALAYGAGLVQRAQHRSRAPAHLPLPVWLERRTATGFEADLQRRVEADPNVADAVRQEAAARSNAEGELFERHVLPAAARLLAELPSRQAALGPGRAGPVFNPTRPQPTPVARRRRPR